MKESSVRAVIAILSQTLLDDIEQLIAYAITHTKEESVEKLLAYREEVERVYEENKRGVVEKTAGGSEDSRP